MSRKSKAAEFVGEGYNIMVTGRSVHVTEPMKDYAMEKVAKLERFSNRIIDVIITMDIQKVEHRVDIVLKAEQIKIKSQASTDNMYASIDKAVDKLEAQLLKYRSRIHDHHAKDRAALEMNVNVYQRTKEIADEEVLESEGEEVEPFHPHKIVKTEKIPLKILTFDEAVMKMDLSQDTFLIFRSEEDMKLKVIYRRNDENYGVIEPES